MTHEENSIKSNAKDTKYILQAICTHKSNTWTEKYKSRVTKKLINSIKLEYLTNDS
jgi:hypothetical protein